MFKYTLYIKKGDPKCEELATMLKSLCRDIRVVDIEDNGVREFMWKDAGMASKIPILVSSNIVVLGVRSIKKMFNIE
ncbi:MAG: hypothetical protein DRJ49_04395 [Thermoprotei archaeon]|nr:MAG: hypothetical protein DRN53_04025 [Thermoprotei archaeon]RLE88861.1 MAG: hypothetical protein DRJ49_04395 [Thermoprotei archaeon]